MGVVFQKPFLIPSAPIFDMDIDVRDKTVVYIVVRRDPANADYHFQGVAAASGQKSAEQVAVEMCRDEHYYIFPAIVNVALPDKHVIVRGLYFPLDLSKGIT